MIFVDVDHVPVLASENILVKTNLWLKFCSSIHHNILSDIPKVLHCNKEVLCIYLEHTAEFYCLDKV